MFLQQLDKKEFLVADIGEGVIKLLLVKKNNNSVYYINGLHTHSTCIINGFLVDFKKLYSDLSSLMHKMEFQTSITTNNIALSFSAHNSITYLSTTQKYKINNIVKESDIIQKNKFYDSFFKYYTVDDFNFIINPINMKTKSLIEYHKLAIYHDVFINNLQYNLPNMKIINVSFNPFLLKNKLNNESIIIDLGYTYTRITIINNFESEILFLNMGINLMKSSLILLDINNIDLVQHNRSVLIKIFTNIFNIIHPKISHSPNFIIYLTGSFNHIQASNIFLEEYFGIPFQFLTTNISCLTSIHKNHFIYTSLLSEEIVLYK